MNIQRKKLLEQRLRKLIKPMIKRAIMEQSKRNTLALVLLKNQDDLIIVTGELTREIQRRVEYVTGNEFRMTQYINAEADRAIAEYEKYNDWSSRGIQTKHKAALNSYDYLVVYSFNNVNSNIIASLDTKLTSDSLINKLPKKIDVTELYFGESDDDFGGDEDED